MLIVMAGVNAIIDIIGSHCCFDKADVIALQLYVWQMLLPLWLIELPLIFIECRLMYTDMYLHWDSHHNIPSKYSVIGTLYHRANTICSTAQYLQKEEKHLNQALKKCEYPSWAINRAKMKIKTTASHNTNRRTGNSNSAQSSTPKKKHCSTLPSRFK